jgi:hypothetical protein
MPHLGVPLPPQAMGMCGEFANATSPLWLELCVTMACYSGGTSSAVFAAREVRCPGSSAIHALPP